MKIIKIAPQALTNKNDSSTLVKNIHKIKGDDPGMGLVVPGLYSVTDELIQAIEHPGKNIDEILLKPFTDIYDSLSTRTQNEIMSHVKKASMLLDAVHANPQGKVFIQDEILVKGEIIASCVLMDAVQEMNPVLLDYNNEKFPLHVEGKPGSVILNMRECQKKGQYLDKESVYIFPGFAGVEKKSGIGKIVKTLGRGGTNMAAFGYAYALGADEVWILAGQDGILDCMYAGKPRTVKGLNYDETQAAGFYGAHLQRGRSIEPLKKMESKPRVYIANFSDINTRTEISDKAKNENEVKLIGSRSIEMYSVNGDVLKLLLKLEGSGVDWFTVSNTGGYGLLCVSGHDRGSEIVEEFHSKGQITASKYDPLSIVGIVGYGLEAREGILERIGKAMHNENINIVQICDYNPSSAGVIISRQYEKPAALALYNEFLGNSTR